MPEITTPTEDMLYEVIDGRIVEKPLWPLESCVASRVMRHLFDPRTANRRGRLICQGLFRLSPEDLQRRPNLAFVSYERWPKQRSVPSADAWDVVPDLAVEIVNPTTAGVEIMKRLVDYFRAGVRQVWVIYPEQKLIYSYTSPTATQILQPGDDLDGGVVLPGFHLAVSALFEDEAGDA